MSDWKIVSMSIGATVHGTITVIVRRLHKSYMAGPKHATYHPTQSSIKRVLCMITTPPLKAEVNNAIPHAIQCAPSGEQVKVCTKCHIEKSLTEYDRQSHTKDGRTTYCKRCAAEYRRTSERYKATKKKVDQRASRKKKNAHGAVLAAVRGGILPPISIQTCACGKQAKHYHHESGYDQENWLNVKAVCTECHKSMH